MSKERYRITLNAAVNLQCLLLAVFSLKGSKGGRKKVTDCLLFLVSEPPKHFWINFMGK